MPKLEKKKTNFGIFFLEGETGGAMLLLREYQQRGCAEEIMPVRPSKKIPGHYTVPATLENAKRLTAIFKNNPGFQWVLTDKYKDYVTDIFNKEKAFGSLYEKVEKIKTTDPDTIGRIVDGKYEIDGYHFKTEPWKHQRTGFKLIREIENILLSWDMRCGKTFTVACAIEDAILRGRIKKVVIFSPGGIMDSVWIRDVDAHTNLQGLSLSFKTTEQRITKARQKLITIPNEDGTFSYVRGEPNYYVFNHDAIRNEKVLDLIKNEIKPDCLVIDESHRFKTPSTQRTKKMTELGDHINANGGMVILMSGTPVTKDIRDLYSQDRIVDPNTFPFSFTVYKHRYCVIKGGYKSEDNSHEQVVGMKNMDELKKRHEVRSYRVAIEECHDMPDQLFTVENVDLTSVQMKHYMELLKELITFIENSVIEVNSLNKFMKLAQVTGGYMYTPEKELYEFKKNPKMEKLEELLDNILATDGRKVVVWTNYRPPVKMIRRLFEEKGLRYAELTTQSEMDRNEAEFKFLNDPECRVMLATPALSEGKDFSVASYNIYYDQSYSFVDDEQSKRRTYTPTSLRHGTIVYINIRANDSVDDLIAMAVENKKNINSMITSERLRQMYHKIKGGKQ